MTQTTDRLNAHVPNLRGVSLAAALRMAFVFSGKADDEIATAMGWGPSVANRIFSNQDYWPNLGSIPHLCNVLGNTIVAQWIIENTEFYVDAMSPMDTRTLLADLRKLMHEVALVIEEGEKALEDNHVAPDEARRVAREIDDLLRVCCPMLARLQATINQRFR